MDGTQTSGLFTVNISRVIVYDADGTTILEDTSNLGLYDDANIAVDLSGNTAVITGLDADYKVEWETDGTHNQVLVEGVGGKFDIGFFGFVESQAVPDQPLDFQVTLTDANGDPVTDWFQVYVDAAPLI